MRIETLAVPVSRGLVRVKVGLGSLEAGLAAVPAGSWAEVAVALEGPEPDLNRQVREAAGGRFEVLKVLAELPVGGGVAWQATGPALNELQPREVFRELLKEKQLEGEELSAVFDELLALREQRVTA
jgi:exonuclease SbcD